MPGAATSTHGPGIVNRARAVVRADGADGQHVVVPAGQDTRSGRSAAHPPLSRLPAAATTTTSAAAAARSADRTAAPSTAARSAGRHTAPEMFTTVAPASTDRRTAAARNRGRRRAAVRAAHCRTELPDGEDPGVRGDPDEAVARVGSGADQPGHRGAVAVAVVEPGAAGEGVAQPDEPPASRGCGATRVDHAIRCPRPVATACAAGRRSRSAGPGPARSATAAGGTHLTDDAPGGGASKASIATTAATPLTVRGPGRRRLRPQVPAGPRRR